MKICDKCGDKFPILIKIHGITRNLNSRRFCLKCSPWGKHNTSNLKSKRPATIDTYSKEEFVTFIRSCRNRSDAFRKLNMQKSGASYSILNRRIERDEIDISHFVEYNTEGASKTNKLPLELILVSNSLYSNTRDLKHRLIKEGILKNQCQKCNNRGIWQGQPLVLQLDHINGKRHDHRKENLRLLCPNCHTQTDTYGGKNIGRQHESRADGLHP